MQLSSLASSQSKAFTKERFTKSTKSTLASSRMKWKSMKHTLGTQITKAKTMTQITSKRGTSSIQPQTPQDVTTRMVTINTYKPSPQENNYNSHGNNYQKNTLQDKLANVSVTLNSPVMKEQLYKIQGVLRHPSQYRDKIRPEDRPVTGEYAKAFNKF